MIQTEEQRSEMGKVDRRAEENEKEILLSIAKVLDTLVAPTEYLVKMKNP